MFIDAIRFKASDPEAVENLFDLWGRTVAPVAAGWLGSVAGVTPSGTFVRVARWESAEALRACEERTEQKEFEERSMRLLAALPESLACPTVDVFLRGPSDDAGFVQVVLGRVRDEDRARTVHQQLEIPFGQHRSDVVGGTIGWVGDGRFVETMCFVSQSDAREGERKELPADLKMLEDEFASLLEGDLEFHDLPKPWVVSP